MFQNKLPIGTLLVLALAAALPVGAQESAGESTVESTRATLSKWVETQQIISKEREAWLLGKEVLQQRLALIEGEIASLDEKIAETREGIGEATTKRRALDRKKGDLGAASRSLADAIGPMEAKTRSLVDRLPAPLRERVGPLAKRIPSDPASSQVSLGERYQNVIGILNEVNKFNQDITLASEVRDLGDGRTAEVKALYVGLGQAYYVTPNGDAAGTGRPSDDGWEWQPNNAIAQDVLKAIAILQNEAVPAYVPLPVDIR